MLGRGVGAFYQHGGPLLQAARPADLMVQRKRDGRMRAAHSCHGWVQRGYHQRVTEALREKGRRRWSRKDGVGEKEGGWCGLERGRP